MRNVGIIPHALFWNGNSGLQCTYFVNNDLQSASVNRHFLNIIIRWCKFCNNDLSFVLGSEQGQANIEARECWNSQGLSISSTADSLSLSDLIFLFTLPRCQVIFQWQLTEKKLGNAKCAKEFSCRFLQNIFSN